MCRAVAALLDLRLGDGDLLDGGRDASRADLGLFLIGDAGVRSADPEAVFAETGGGGTAAAAVWRRGSSSSIPRAFPPTPKLLCRRGGRLRLLAATTAAAEMGGSGMPSSVWKVRGAPNMLSPLSPYGTNDRGLNSRWARAEPGEVTHNVRRAGSVQLHAACDDDFGESNSAVSAPVLIRGMLERLRCLILLKYGVEGAVSAPRSSWMMTDRGEVGAAFADTFVR